ncbi:unnamed protein product [Cyclocybe aegerita]|uniref:DAGKc domain-containing protein n=1 Tax=Cyclocybe aegerita TaxID=1973307 RepID=A0A8S0VVA1_CYCAE|nr:unnamed protein product [Cyclocybe aegerita]
MSPSTISIRVGILHVNLSLKESSLSIQRPTKSKPTAHHDIAHKYILRATLDDKINTLKVAYLTKKKNRGYILATLEGIVGKSEVAKASEWAENLMKVVYDDAGLKRSRRLLVFVNPFGGTSKGASLFAKKIDPVFKNAGCSVEVIHTTHQGHALEVVKSLTAEYDAIITVSGDGLVHEVLNGLAQHADPLKALATPVAPIPTGSGNGTSLNLLGMEDGFDIIVAALNAVKGKPMKVDLFSVTQGSKRSISFMSQSLGLMADLDLGTEHLRWMGDTRFMYGLLRGLVKFKPCPVQLSFKAAETDKDKMAEFVHARKKEITEGNGVATSSIDSVSGTVGPSLPPIEHGPDDQEGWTTFDEPILYVYAGKGPYVGRDFMAFPVSLPDDGLIDLMAMSADSRGDLISAMDGAPQGNSFWHPKVHYVKAHAYRIKPLKKKGYLSIDGEPFPFEEYQVEVHKGLGTLLSPYGHYAALFEPRKHKTTKHKKHSKEGNHKNQ